MNPTGAPALPALNADVLRTLHGRSLMLTSDWSTPEIDTLLAVAARFAAIDRAHGSAAFLPDELE